MNKNKKRTKNSPGHQQHIHKAPTGIEEKVAKRRSFPYQMNMSVQTLQGFSDSSISSAINDAMRGDWSQSVALLKVMSTDDKFSAALNKRIQGLIRSDRVFKPGTSEFDPTEERESMSEYICKQVEELTYYSLTDNELTLFFRDYIAHGISLAFVEWITYEGYSVPCLAQMDLTNLRWNDYDQKFTYRNTVAGEVDVCPGDGNWIMMSVWKPGEVCGVVSSLAKTWFYKNLLSKQSVQATSNQQDPIILLKKDPASPVSFETDEIDLSSLMREIQFGKANRVLYLEGYELDTKDTSAGFSITDVADYISYFDRNYLIGLLGSNLGTEIDGGGSRAAAMTHAGVERNYSESDSIVLSHCLSRQYLPYVAEFNWNDTWTIAPTVTWVIKPSIDAATIFTALSLVPENMEVENLEEVFESLGLKIRVKEETIGL